MSGSRAADAARLYSADVLKLFAAGQYEAFVATGGSALRPRLARSLALAALRPGLVVVDLGSGRGEAAGRAAKRGAQVSAVDISPPALELVLATAKAMGVNVRCLAADCACLPIASRSADRVLMLDVLEHLDATGIEASLDEVHRILKPDGYVVVHTLPNRWALDCAYPALRLLMPGLPAEPRSPYERVVHVSEQDPIALRRALSAAGLEHRVWVEEWTTRQAMRSRGLPFPDAVREVGYPVLRRRVVRTGARLAMRTPLAAVAGNDLFAVAWPIGGRGPTWTHRFRPIR